jgi:hypothetical protein
MNYSISFKERVKLAMEQLSKQSPVTLEKAKKQVEFLKQKSILKNNNEKHILKH